MFTCRYEVLHPSVNPSRQRVYGNNGQPVGAEQWCVAASVLHMLYTVSSKGIPPNAVHTVNDSLLDAVVGTRKANNQENDKYQNQNHQDNQDLHLHVLPPHLTA